MFSLAAKRQDGFGLIELLVSMTIMNVGILALVASFQAGALALQRAGKISTAAAVANIQMERYHALRYADIRLDSVALTTAQGNATYTGDAAYSGSQQNSACGAPSPPEECQPIRSLKGPDGKRYRIDTYIVLTTPQNGRAVKKVTIVVRDANALSSRPWARVASNFDESMGL